MSALTASGERFDPMGMTAASRTLPLGSYARVTNKANGRSVIVRINDRGPFTHNLIMDLARGAAASIGLYATGDVRIEPLSAEAMR